MKQIKRLKMIVGMTISFVWVFFAASCSNDEFFGFKSSYNHSDILK